MALPSMDSESPEDSALHTDTNQGVIIILAP